MNKLTYVSSLIVFTVVFLPISAHSTSSPKRGPIPFSVYDKDNDGLITEKEFFEVRAERKLNRSSEKRPMWGAANAPSFSAFDTNKDGSLTQEELAVGQKIQMSKRLNRGLGQDRGLNKGMPNFLVYDLDGDGVILEKEFNEARRKRINERVQQGYRMRNLDDAPSFSDVDANGDGKISSEEFTVHQSKRRQKNLIKRSN